MKSSEVTTTEGTRPRQVATQTKHLADSLKKDGYNIEYSRGGVAPKRGHEDSVAYIEARVSAGDLPEIKSKIENAKTDVQHEIIDPNSCRALQDPPPEDAESKDSIRIVIIPRMSNQFAAAEVAEKQASYL